MRFGLHALGIGPGADPAVIVAVARAAERAGFARLWAGEHVVMAMGPDEPYPYTDDGVIAVPSEADWLDPFTVLTLAAGATSRIGLATGVLLLPEHNPLIVAKQAASLDVVSAGRLTLGVGIGWSAAEFEALGVPFRARGRRTEEYVRVLRALWSTDVTAFDGEFVRFDRVRSYPKPVGGRTIPVVVGGNGDAALARVAAVADGWYGFNVPLHEVGGRVAALRDQCRRCGREVGALSIAVAPSDARPADVPALAADGVTETVLVQSPPSDASEVEDWVSALADEWGVAAAA
jgi:probable F420-dependent oxidoreductase